MMQVKLNCEELSYSGRIDRRNAEKPEFIFPASSLCFRFFGRAALLRVRNRHGYWNNSLGAVIDGVQKTFPLCEEGETLLWLLSEEQDKEHTILLFKRMDGCHECILEELSLSEGSYLLPAPEKPKRRMEVFGDSVSAGEVSEAVEYTGKADPQHNGEYSNSWYSYAWMTARRLHAELHDIAQGGVALLDGTGWFHEPDYIGMESVWDKLHYNPDFGEVVPWDFQEYIPQVVVVAIGQNDSHPRDYMKEKYDGKMAQHWREHYGLFLKKLRRHYPEAQIICCTTLLEHDASWDCAIDEVCRHMRDEKISHYVFRRNGKGTPGHLRISEAEEMAEELASYIDSLKIEGWEQKL